MRDVPWRTAHEIAGLVAEFVFAPNDAVVGTLDDNFVALGGHNREQAISADDAQRFDKTIDRLRHGVSAKLLFAVDWSPLDEIDLATLASTPADHEPTLFMEDTGWPDAPLDDYVDFWGRDYYPLLARQPEAEMFAGFGDFAFYEVTLKGAHLVAGFGRIVDLAPADLLTDLTGAEALVEAEPEVIAHMNADHAETCRLYATKLLNAPDGEWRCVGCDPDGLDLQNGRAALRLPVPQRVTQLGVLRAVLKQLAEQARAA